MIDAYTRQNNNPPLPIAADYSYFLFECLKKQITAQVDGGPITADKIVEILPVQESNRLCKLAEYKAYFLS